MTQYSFMCELLLSSPEFEELEFSDNYERELSDEEMEEWYEEPKPLEF